MVKASSNPRNKNLSDEERKVKAFHQNIKLLNKIRIPACDEYYLNRKHKLVIASLFSLIDELEKIGQEYENSRV